MDFDFTEAQALIRSSARRFLERECPLERVREIINSDLGYDPALWGKFAELGWLGLTLSAEYGGAEGSFLDLALLQEEMGRALIPSPFIQTVLLSGGIIQKVGSEAQKEKCLSGISKGDLIISVAVLESGGRWHASDIKTVAVKTSEGYVINGTKLFVPYAHVADYIICVARTQDDSDCGKGMSLFLLNAAQDGIRRNETATITGEKLCEVVFEDVTALKEDVVGEVNHGWEAIERIFDEGAVAECASMVGGARRALEIAVDYSKQRMQFGVPIGSFQAIQHKCADIIIEVDGAAFITYAGAWALSQNSPDASAAASKAKAWCSDTYAHVASEGIQILGAMGFTQEHDMQLFFRRSRASAEAFGDSQFHRERMAGMLNL